MCGLERERRFESTCYSVHFPFHLTRTSKDDCGGDGQCCYKSVFPMILRFTWNGWGEMEIPGQSSRTAWIMEEQGHST